ncbi:hypothetical protein R6Q57_015227 [Mikania cordata]
MNFDTTEADDTAFYAQLTSQILLLMDEEDDTNTIRPRKGAPELGWRPVTGGSGGGRISRSLMSGTHFGWLEGGRSSQDPVWMESFWANNGTGTGVFIPRVAATGKPRRKRHHKYRRNKNGGRIDPSSAAEQKIHW